MVNCGGWILRFAFNDVLNRQQSKARNPNLWSVLGTGRSAARDQFTVIYERSFTGEPPIEKFQAKPAHVNTTVYLLDVIENPVEYQKLL